MKKLIIIVCIGMIYSCTNNQTVKNADPTNSNNGYVLNELTKNKLETDSLISNKGLNEECFYNNKGNFEKDSCDKSEFSEAWHIWKNPADKIIYAKHELSSESTDIFVQDHYYFNCDGKLFCRDLFASFVNTLCSDRGLTHNKTYYYDQGVPKDSMISLYDSEYKKYSMDSCLIPYSVIYEIPINASMLEEMIKK